MSFISVLSQTLAASLKDALKQEGQEVNADSLEKAITSVLGAPVSIPKAKAVKSASAEGEVKKPSNRGKKAVATCTRIITRGDRKGDPCGNSIYVDGTELCATCSKRKKDSKPAATKTKKGAKKGEDVKVNPAIAKIANESKEDEDCNENHSVRPIEGYDGKYFALASGKLAGLVLTDIESDKAKAVGYFRNDKIVPLTKAERENKDILAEYDIAEFKEAKEAKEAKDSKKPQAPASVKGKAAAKKDEEEEEEEEEEDD